MDLEEARWQREEDDRYVEDRLAEQAEREADIQRESWKEPDGSEGYEWPPMPPEAELPDPPDIEPEDAPF